MSRYLIMSLYLFLSISEPSCSINKPPTQNKLIQPTMDNINPAEIGNSKPDLEASPGLVHTSPIINPDTVSDSVDSCSSRAIYCLSTLSPCLVHLLCLPEIISSSPGPYLRAWVACSAWHRILPANSYSLSSTRIRIHSWFLLLDQYRDVTTLSI